MQDRKRALMILAAFACIVFLAAVIVFFQSIGITQHPLTNAPPPETIGKGIAP